MKDEMWQKRQFVLSSFCRLKINLCSNVYKFVDHMIMYNYVPTNEHGQPINNNNIGNMLGYNNMPNMNGIEAAEKALAIVPELKIIVFSMFGDEEYFNRMIDIGVKGFILKSSGITDVEQAISDVMQDKKYFSSVLPNKNTNKLNSQTDSDQEPQVPIPWW